MPTARNRREPRRGFRFQGGVRMGPVTCRLISTEAFSVGFTIAACGETEDSAQTVTSDMTSLPASMEQRVKRACLGRAVETGSRRVEVRLTDQTFTCKTHSGAPRLSGAALAAMHEVLTLSICKR